MILAIYIAVFVIVRCALWLLPRLQGWRGSRRAWASPLLVMGIARWGGPPRPPICAGCAFAHIVRGVLRQDERIFCGYIFPPREHPFVVRECTDFRPRRKPPSKLAA